MCHFLYLDVLLGPELPEEGLGLLLPRDERGAPDARNIKGKKKNIVKEPPVFPHFLQENCI